MTNLIVILILLVLVTAAVSYIIREKKKGRNCIGCPYASGCNKRQCGCEDDDGVGK